MLQIFSIFAWEITQTINWLTLDFHFLLMSFLASSMGGTQTVVCKSSDTTM